MSTDEVQETESTEIEGTDAELDAKPSYEELEALLAKTRQEAAGRRVKNKETQEKLAEFEKWKLDQMSEVDRAKAEKAALEVELRELRSTALRTSAAEAAGLDPKFAPRILGETKEEMVADAKRLAAELGSTTQGVGTLAGKRGKGVGTNQVMSEDDWLRAQLSN